tara:strand:+ start:167 stop:373 length:207 start_codon:yes stop_codon:yes gene_type:complete
MCLICVDLQKDKLTSYEARRNLGELQTSLDKEHIEVVMKLIWQKEEDDLEEYYEECYLNWNQDNYESD